MRLPAEALRLRFGTVFGPAAIAHCVERLNFSDMCNIVRGFSGHLPTQPGGRIGLTCATRFTWCGLGNYQPPE
jgi:hypothetical protein